MEKIDKIDLILLGLERWAKIVQFDIDSDERYQELCELITKLDWEGFLSKIEKKKCQSNLDYLTEIIFLEKHKMKFSIHIF